MLHKKDFNFVQKSNFARGYPTMVGNLSGNFFEQVFIDFMEIVHISFLSCHTAGSFLSVLLHADLIARGGLVSA